MTESKPLCLSLFGGFSLERSEMPVEGLRAREADRLMAYLILAGKPVSAANVAGTFWPATGSMDSLRQSVRQARKVLDEEAARLDLSDGMLHFHIDGLCVDMVRFDRLARSEEPESWRRAVDIYSGPLLMGWDDPWVVPEREKRRQRYADLQRRLGEAALIEGRFDEAAERLRTCVRLRPSEERAWRQLIRAQAEMGERVAALESFDRYRDYLHKHGGLAPPPETSAYCQKLREGVTLRTDVPSDPSEPVGGAVPLDSSFYIIRPADHVFCPAIKRRESLVLIKGPRQSGKSSLLARGLQTARHTGALTAVTDFETLTPADLTTLDTLCLRLAADLADQLEIPISPDENWQPYLGPGVNLERFLIRHVMGTVSTPLVWAMDGVDRLFPLPYGGEFFSLLRTWHEKRALEPLRPWRRLTLAIACATEAHLFIRDLNKSPFNVGVRAELEDLTKEQIAELNRRYHSPLSGNEEIERFYDLVGGHPYLVRRGLQEMAAHGVTLTQLTERAALDNGPFGDHLRRLARSLAEDPALAAAAREALRGTPCSPTDFFRLRSAGVLTGELSKTVRPRCRLYAAYLTQWLGK